MSRNLERRASGLVVARNTIDVAQTHVKFHSSTLRDGQQHTGIVYDVKGKDEVATIEHEVLNPEIIEGGWPGATDTDTQFFQLAQDRPYHDRLAAFGMLRRPGSHVERDAGVKFLLDSNAPIVTYVGKTHIEQVRKTLNTTPEENLLMIEESVAYAKGEGRRVVYDAEHFFDSYDLDPEYAMETLYAAARGGAESIALCDTVGKQLPASIFEKVAKVMDDEALHKIYREKNQIIDPEVKMPLGIHAHNDLELAVANTLAAVDGGVTYIQGTGAGKGERVGNANLTVIAYLLNREGYRDLPDEQKKRLTEYDTTIFKKAGLPKNPNQPISGLRAHGTMSGIHQGAMIRDASSYVIEDPTKFGNDWDVFLSGQSGSSAVRKKMNDWGLPADEQIVSSVTALLKSMEGEGYRWIGQEASVELLMRRQYPDYEEKKPFTITSNVEGGRITNTTLEFSSDSKPVNVPIENGDVTKTFNALRFGLSTGHTELLSLEAVNSHYVQENGTTRAFITVTNGTDTWTTVGVGKNATEAGIEAASDALEFALYHPSTQETPAI